MPRITPDPLDDPPRSYLECDDPYCRATSPEFRRKMSDDHLLVGWVEVTRIGGQGQESWDEYFCPEHAPGEPQAAA